MFTCSTAIFVVAWYLLGWHSLTMQMVCFAFTRGSVIAVSMSQCYQTRKRILGTAVPVYVWYLSGWHSLTLQMVCFAITRGSVIAVRLSQCY